MPLEKIKLKYQEVNLDDVMNYFVKGFEGVNIGDYKYYIDLRQNKVIFKLYISELVEYKE